MSEFNLPIYSSLIHFIIQGVTLGYWAYLLNLLFHHVMEGWSNGIGIFNLRLGILLGGESEKVSKWPRVKKNFSFVVFPSSLAEKGEKGYLIVGSGVLPTLYMELLEMCAPATNFSYR